MQEYKVSSSLAKKLEKYREGRDRRAKRVREDVEKNNFGNNNQPTIMGCEIDALKDFGLHVMRIMPSRDLESNFYVAMRMHFIPHPGIGDSVDKQSFIVPVICPRLYGNVCDLCDEWDVKVKAIFKESSSKDEGKEKLQILRQKSQYSHLTASTRYYSVKLPEGSSDYREFKVLSFGATVHSKFDSILFDNRYGGDFTDLIYGFPVAVEKKKTGATKWDVEYDVKYNISDSGPVCKDPEGLEDFISKIPDLHKWSTEEYQSGPEGMLYTIDQINRMMRGEDPKEVRGFSTKESFSDRIRRERNEEFNGNTLAPGVDPDDEDDDDYDEDRYDEMDRKELRAEAKERGLPRKKSFSDDDYREMLRKDDREDSDGISALKNKVNNTKIRL